MITAPKPGSPSELVHFGVKGMKWGVRNDKPSSVPAPKKALSEAEKKAEFRARAKKVAIGVGVLTAVAGAAFVTYKLGQSGKLPISSLNQVKKVAESPKTTAAVKKVLAEPTDIIHASRGKTKGFRFFKHGNLPDPYSEYEKAFGHDKFTHGLFERVAGGKIAASFNDPEGRTDRAGRLITHQVLIPPSMTHGIESMKDVMDKIWPKVKETYDDT